MKHPSRASMIEAHKQLAIPVTADPEFFAQLAAQAANDKKFEELAHANAADGFVMVAAASLALLVLALVLAVLAGLAKFPLAHWLVA